MTDEEFARQVEALRLGLYRAARLYLKSEVAALDAVDEAVYRALRNRSRLRRPESFRPWITRILLNLCRDELRRQRRLRPLEETEEAGAEAYDGLPLRDALDRLPPPLREVVVLRYFAGYTLGETAEALGIPPGTAATRQRRALALLRLDLEEEDGL